MGCIIKPKSIGPAHQTHCKNSGIIFSMNLLGFYHHHRYHTQSKNPIYHYNTFLLTHHPSQFQSFEMAAQLATAVNLQSVGVGVGFRPTGARARSRSVRPLVVRAATAVAPKYTAIKPLADRVLVKIKEAEQQTAGGILLPSTAQTKPQGGEVVAVGEGRTVGEKTIEISVQPGTQIVYSKYAGTELEFNGSNHLLLKEDDIVGVLETDEIKDLKPLNDRVLIKGIVCDNNLDVDNLWEDDLYLVGNDIQVAEAEEKTAGGVLLTETSKEKPAVGTVIAVGPGALDKDGNRKPVSILPGSSVMYSKYSGSDFKGSDGSNYIVLKSTDILAVLS